MFSIIDWCKYEEIQTIEYLFQIEIIMKKFKVSLNVQSIILSFIICPKCKGKYINQENCNCWFI